MNLRRSTHLILTALPRAIRRRGFGIQSPWAYELVRDVLFEPLPYYAYGDQHLNTSLQRQLFRIRNHFAGHIIVVIDATGAAAESMLREALAHATPDTILILEHTNDKNADLWDSIVSHPAATVTFDMRRRGMATFDPKRIKQNYLL